MRAFYLILAFLFLSVSNTSGQDRMSVNTRASVSGSIPSDNTLRYYRLAIPVTRTAYVEDFDENYNNVLQFWRDCEEFANRMFVPLGICFDVVEDERLLKSDYFPNEGSESFIYTLQANGTSNTNDLIGADSYDVAMWVYHRDVTAENSGLSAEGGVYSSSAKGSGYSKTDKWVVAHELGHMFGAPHTTTGEGSLMDSGGDDFFSYPSIKKIRDLAVEKGAGSANNAVKVSNSAPVFDNENMKDSYRIPQGACIAIPVYANDTDGNMLTYSAIGCSSSTVGNVIEGGYMPHFASLIPQTSNVIDYRPKFTADIVYDDFYYEQIGTNIPAMNAGSYNIAILVNDVPASMEYDYLTANPFYSNYAVWDATVEIVGGTSFNASMSPAKNSYSAGEQVTVSWGVNSNYFTADSRLRITMSTDYGKTFSYVLADNVPALDGSKAVTLPNINVGNIDVDFKTATRSMRGGIIRVEEIGGVAYTLTTLSPGNGGGFNITGGGDAPMTYTISVTAGDGGTATIDGKSSTTVAAGSSVTLSATPHDGYIFDAWYSGGRFVSLEAEYTFTPTASGTYNALFEKEAGTPVTYKITATASPVKGGTATVNGSTSATVEANGTIELSAKANDGYTFVNWTSGGKEVTTQADYKIYNVAGDADYVANFKEEAQVSTYTITVSANPAEGGTATVNGKASVEVEANGTIELSAKANDGYTFVNWTSGGKEVTIQADYKVYNVAGDADYFANFEQEVQDVLTTGYYHLVSRATDRNEHLYNNAFSSDNTYHFTLQSNTMVNTNNGIWYITKNGNQLGIKNGDGKPVVAGKSYNESILGTFSNLNIHTTINDADDGYTYYYFNEALNCSDSKQDYFKVGGINYLTTWSGHPDATDNQWRFERVDTEDKNIYDVVVDCTDKDVYVTYGSEYAFDGGFFITNETITAQQLTAKKNNAAVQDVTVLVEGNTIRVVDTEYVDITVSTTPAEGGSVTINGEATGAKRVIKGSEVTLAANANNGYNFTGWYDGQDLVSNENPYTFTTTTDITYTANFAQNETFPDGAYKIFWQQDGRGYLAYHTGYPNEAKLADVTLGNYGSSHFASTSSEVDLVWYLITAQDGNRYLFHAATGKFLTAGTVEAGKNAKANVLSATEALPIRIEENTAHSGYYVIMATVNSTDALLSSGCGTPSTSGSPVRWWYDNNNKDFMSDGGSPLTLIPVKDVVVEESIMAAARAIINGTEESVLTTGYYRFKCIGGGKYLSSEVSASNGNRLVMDGKDNLFYYNQSSLLSYAQGQYIGISQTENIYNVTLSDISTPPVATEVIPTAGVYYISLGGMNDYGNGIRYIYGNADEADSGTQDSGYPNDAGYKWSVEEITELPVEIGKTGWATMYAPVALELPIGVTAYYIEKENVKEDYITLTAITDNVIPALTGVILYSKEAVGIGKSYDFTITESSATYDTNILEGSVARTYVDLEAYVLSEQDGHVGLYKAEMNLLDNKAFLNNSHKAYLPVAKLESMSTSSGWRFNIEGNGVTAINKIQNEESDNEIYDLTGRKVHSISIPGIYISNGKKIFVR